MIGALAFPLFPALSFNAAKTGPRIKKGRPEGRPSTVLPRERRPVLEIDACARVDEVEIVQRDIHLAEC